MRIAVVACLVVSALLARDAVAQTATGGSIRGYVKDEQDAVLPGVRISATSSSVAGIHGSDSDKEGYYRLIALAPGTYTVTAELDGFAKWRRDNVVVSEGLNISVPIVMKVGSLSETVEVKRDTPMLETLRPVQAINISGEFQRSVPLSVRREWADSLALTPGVVSLSTSSTSTTYYSHGADTGSQVIQLDGADIASNQQGSTAYIAMNTDAIADVHVKTAGVDAASPLGQGAVISIATPSGTNVVTGAGTLYYQPQRWNGNNNAAGTTSASGTVQPDLSLGGPIRRNHLWFFGAYRYTNSHTGVSRSATQLAALRALYPAFEAFDSENRAHYTFAKITAGLSSRHQLTAFHQYDSSPQDNVGPNDTARFLRTYVGGHALSGRWISQWSDTFGSRFSVSYNNKSFPIRPLSTDQPSRPVFQSTFISSGRRVGSGALAVLDNASGIIEQKHNKLTIAADATYQIRTASGAHDVQSGLYLQPRLYREIPQVFLNDGFDLEELALKDPANPGGGTQAFHRRMYGVDRVALEQTITTDYAAYLQDAWAPTSRLTLSVGIRADVISRTDQILDALVQRSVAIGPRVGAVYVVSKDARDGVRASWSRVHDVVPVTNGQTLSSNTAGFRDLYDNDLDGTFETTFVTPSTTVLAANRQIDAHRPQPRVDEWLVGYRRQYRGGIVTDVGVIRRGYRDRSAWVEVNGIYDGGVFRGYRDETVNDILRITNNSWNWPVYTALEFQASKKSTALSIVASYSRQWRHLEGDWQPNDPASFIQPDAFPNNGGVGGIRTSSLDANSLSGTQMTGAQQWQDHVLRSAITYRAPWGVEFATSYTYQSGQWSGPIVTRIAQPDPRFGPPTLTLSNGRLVSNPLATLIRFAHPTRSDGQFHLGGSHLWNIRVGREIRLARARLSIAVDVYNILNYDANYLLQSGANQLFNVNYGTGRSLQLPRSTAVSARLVF